MNSKVYNNLARNILSKPAVYAIKYSTEIVGILDKFSKVYRNPNAMNAKNTSQTHNTLKVVVVVVSQLGHQTYKTF